MSLEPTRRWLALLLGLTMLHLSACAALAPSKPEPPDVRITGVRPLNLSLTQQRLEFTLDVSNPNGFDLPVQELDFVAKLAGEKLAKGRSTEGVTVPANGNAELKVEVSAGITRMFDTFRGMLDAGSIELDYGVTGTVKLANWPSRIPFNVEGLLNELGPDSEDDTDEG